MLTVKCDVLIVVKWSMLVLQVLKVQMTLRPGKACVENKKKNDANVNNWMCEACDAEKTHQGGKRRR
jgi:hypothetical protein